MKTLNKTFNVLDTNKEYCQERGTTREYILRERYFMLCVKVRFVAYFRKDVFVILICLYIYKWCTKLLKCHNV